MTPRLFPGWPGAFLATLVLTASGAAAVSPSPETIELPGTLSADADELRWMPQGGYDSARLSRFASPAATDPASSPQGAVRVEIPAGFRVVGLRLDRIESRLAAGGRSPAPDSGTAEPPLRYAGTGFWRGHAVAELVLRPVSVTADGRTTITRSIDYTLLLAPVSRDGPRPVTPLRSAARQPEGTAAYTPFRPTDYPSLDGSLVEYVIISPDPLVDDWQAWADWKTRNGVPAVVRSLSSVAAACPQGTDLAAKIRAFIRDAYRLWGTEYVLLGGDAGLLPTRSVHFNDSPVWQFSDLVTDLYFSCLDGSWDGDGDGLFGEGYDPSSGAPGDSADLYPEVFVGRAPVTTPSEVSVFISKTRDYRTTPIAQNQVKVAFLAQESYGGLSGCDMAEQAISLAAAPWSTVKLCDPPDGAMTFTAVRDTLNRGYGFVTSISHGDPFKYPTGDGNYIRIEDVAGLTNDNRFSIYFYASSNTSQLGVHCINTAALLNPVGGAVAVIGPTALEFHTDWAAYMEEFYRLLFREGGEVLGELNELHKVPFIAGASSDGTARWAHLTSTLLGDPELHVWRSLPLNMTLAHAGTTSVGDSTYTVTVSHAGLPVEGALVTLWLTPTGDYARGFTDAAGQIVLSFHPGAEGNADLTATHARYRTATAAVAVTSAGAADLVIAGLRYDDDGSGSSSGNGDGVPDAGERIELGVTLENRGGLSTTDVSGQLVLREGAVLTLDLAQNGVPQPERVFLGSAGANPTALPLSLPLAGGDPPVWGRPFFTAGAPPDTGTWFWQDPAGWHLRMSGARAGMAFSGSLSTDGVVLSATPYRLESSDVLDVSPGRIGFDLSLDSTDVEDGVDFLLADSSYARVLSGSAAWGTLAPGDTATRTFLVESDVSAPDRHQVRLGLSIAGTVSGPQAWSEGVRMELAAPLVGEDFHALDDSSDGGDGDGRLEDGETVRWYSTVLNRGHGAASGVAGTLRAISGVTVSDSTSTYGDVPGGEPALGTPPFRLTGGTAPRVVELELRDSAGRTWTSTIHLEGPDPPSALTAGPLIPQVETAIDLTWIPPSTAGLLGYNVYRISGGTSGFARLNSALVTASALFHDRSVEADSTYVYSVTAVDTAGNESARSVPVTATAPPRYQGTFPRETQGTVWSSPLCVDVDGDGALEVFVGCEDGNLYAFNADGSTRAGWPRELGGEVWSSPAAGNLDADPQLEIVVGCNNRNLYAFKPDGSGLLHPDGLFATLDAQVRSTPALADLDGDDSLEVVVGTHGGRLYALEGNGTAYLPSGPVFATIGGVIAASPTIADLDGDGAPEVLACNLTGRIYAFRFDGAPYGSPTGLFYDTGSAFWSSPAVGDVDDDGEMDVVCGDWSGRVYRWTGQGVVPSGWPVVTGGKVWSSPALGDLNGDGRLECLVGSSDRRMYALQWDGSALPGWPFTAIDSIWSSPAIADLSGDGNPDVVFGAMDRRIYALQGDGTRVPGWPRLFTDRCFGSAPAVGDLDHDGDVEVVAASYEGRIYVWDLGRPWNAAASPWPMYAHDAARTGWTDSPSTGVAPEGAAGVRPMMTRLMANRPNPFHPSTEIRFDLAVRDEVTLSIYDVSGRRVRRLVSATRSPGTYSVTWDGRDDAGTATASGIYFCRLSTGGSYFTRKMVLTR